MSNDSSFDRIPVVDLERWFSGARPRSQFVEELRQICHHVGFFQVINHNVDKSLISSLFNDMVKLFDLPEDTKRLIDKRQSRHFRGWEAVGTEYTNNQPDVREQVDVWSEMEAMDPKIAPFYLNLLGPNQWLPDEILPGHRDRVLLWMEQAGALAGELLGVLSLGLGLEEGHINKLFGEKCMSLTKLIRYPKTPAGAAGVNPHHDTGFLTVLADGATPGLQVQNQQGEWIDVPCIENALIINLGEMLQGMTGNYFVATPHRVITDQVRYSMGYFHGPSLHTSLDMLPLGKEFHEAVSTSPHHANAGFMALKEETEAGTENMRSNHKPSIYGEQLWNYFSRSYPELMQRHYPGH